MRSDEAGEMGGEETRAVAEYGSDELGVDEGGRSPIRRKIPSLSLRRTPSIHSATMTFLVEYSGYTFGI
jgi:hypothetical protein